MKNDIEQYKMFVESAEKNSEKRTRCMVYTRVMGYHRPVESFNIGKKGEHNQRVKFIESKDCL